MRLVQIFLCRSTEDLGGIDNQVPIKILLGKKNSQYERYYISFKNSPDESLHEGYLRYKSYLDNCPHHRLPDWLITHTFYGGINNENRMNLDTASNGSFLSYTYDEA